MRALPLTMAVAMLAMAGCASAPVSVDRDETVDFAKYRTFGWWPAPGSTESEKSGPTTLLGSRVRRDVARILTERGLAASDDPDLRIAHHLATREVRGVTVWDHGYRWRSRGRTYASVRS